jgi:hypothetical protein
MEINTAGISWKLGEALPQNRVRWQFFEENIPSAYELQYQRRDNLLIIIKKKLSLLLSGHRSLTFSWFSGGMLISSGGGGGKFIS